MKRILCVFLFCTFLVCCSAQTRPHWLDISNKPIIDVKALYLAGADGGPVYMQTNGRNASGIPEYADNATAAAAGLPVGAMYHTTGALKVVVP